MSHWTIILLLVHHPLFEFYQTIVGPFDFVQYLLCLSVSFAVCALTRTFRSFDVLTNAQWYGHFCYPQNQRPRAFRARGLWHSLERLRFLLTHKSLLGFSRWSWSPPLRSVSIVNVLLDLILG
jgi:hypothetical protein